jgi:rhamnosyltransferase
VSIIADSASTDATPALAAEFGHRVITIRREDFNHGGTRQYLAEEAATCDYLIYLTQDAVLADEHALANMVQMLAENPTIGAVCGRQLPHSDATPLAAFARAFNYPAQTYIRTQEDIETLGLKSIFLSNSFSAYRRTALEAVGGFPKNVIFGEDMFVAAKMMQAGWHLGYAGNACVHHSHNYGLKEDFRRAFDIGVFHRCEPWLLENFGCAQKEGKKFVLQELGYLAKHAPLRMPEALLRTAIKVTAYQLGKRYDKLLPDWNKRFSLNRKWWQQTA